MGLCQTTLHYGLDMWIEQKHQAKHISRSESQVFAFLTHNTTSLEVGRQLLHIITNVWFRNYFNYCFNLIIFNIVAILIIGVSFLAAQIPARWYSTYFKAHHELDPKNPVHYIPLIRNILGKLLTTVTQTVSEPRVTIQETNVCLHSHNEGTSPWQEYCESMVLPTLVS